MPGLRLRVSGFVEHSYYNVVCFALHWFLRLFLCSSQNDFDWILDMKFAEGDSVGAEAGFQLAYDSANDILR